MSSKVVLDNSKTYEFRDTEGNLKAAYLPNLNIDDKVLFAELAKVPFTRVHYISPYQKANRTPRYTWAYGKVDPQAPENKTTEYRGLTFQEEIMPDWLNGLALFCRQIAIMNWNFDPGYNSAIIGKYDSGDDQIGFHRDDETFLAHHFCTNVTLGVARDFQFKVPTLDGGQVTNEIKLAHKSAFFFLGLEHALPKRAGVANGQIRYSISFRNMANMIGIGNSFYYCRGLAGAIDNTQKAEYTAKLKALQESRAEEGNL